MRNIKIVADSSCDLFEVGGGSTPFETAPMKICTAEREFVDDASLDIGAMVEYLYNCKEKSRSSCPNTTDWLSAFGDADEVFCVTITSGLSGSYNSACAAKKIYEESHPGARVFVIDSLSAGCEVTLIIEKLDACISAGMTYEEICAAATEYLGHTGLLFMLKSLKTFANNGRVSPLTAKLVGIAGICIVGRASDVGTLEPMHKCRGESHSLRTIVRELADQGYCGGKVSIGHCENAEGAKFLSEKIAEVYPDALIEIHPFRGLCSFYAERGGILVGFEKA